MAELSYLSIEHAPNKATYQAGDKFERYGMIIKAHYSDGTSNWNQHSWCNSFIAFILSIFGVGQQNDAGRKYA